MLVFPIVADGADQRPVGVLQMINKVGGAFDDHDEAMLRSFVPTAARVIADDPMFYKSEQAEQSEADRAFTEVPHSKRDRSRRPSVQAVEEAEGDEEEEEEECLEEEDESEDEPTAVSAGA